MGILGSKLFAAAALTAAAFAAGAPASANPVTFVFSNSAGQSNFGVISSNNGALDGNGRLYTAGAGADQVNVRASGWSIDGNTVRDSFLGAYGGGLGVTSGDEVSGSGNRHTTDNQMRFDFILLQFDRPVSLESAVFNAFKLSGTNYKDNDATIGFGNSATAWNLQPSLNNMNISALNALIPIANRSASLGNGSNTARMINPGQSVGNLWFIAAALPDHNTDGRFDAFKLDQLRVDAVLAVPEPSTWAMMIAGFGFIGGAMRRRRKQTLVLQTA